MLYRAVIGLVIGGLLNIYLLRHGEAESNATTPDWSLSDRGKRQARLTGRYLAGLGITRILSSPLLRALGTAHEVAETIDFDGVEVWPDLREGFDSPYVGAFQPTIPTQFPRMILPKDIPLDGWSYAGDTYESFVSRCRRVQAALFEHCGERDRVLLVTHGGFINHFLHSLLRMPDLSPIWFETANCGLTTIRFVPMSDQQVWPLYPAVEVEILSMNDFAHLADFH